MLWRVCQKLTACRQIWAVELPNPGSDWRLGRQLKVDELTIEVSRVCVLISVSLNSVTSSLLCGGDGIPRPISSGRTDLACGVSWRIVLPQTLRSFLLRSLLSVDAAVQDKGTLKSCSEGG